MKTLFVTRGAYGQSVLPIKQHPANSATPPFYRVGNRLPATG
jgi:hypothetical protein